MKEEVYRERPFAPIEIALIFTMEWPSVLLSDNKVAQKIIIYFSY